MNVRDICDTLNDVLSAARGPIQKINAKILAASSINRPGISPSLVATRIIMRQSEAGVPTGPNQNTGRNMSEAMERIRVEEIVRALKMDSVVQIGIAPGEIKVVGEVTTPIGPIPIEGTNVKAVYGSGIIG